MVYVLDIDILLDHYDTLLFVFHIKVHVNV